LPVINNCDFRKRNYVVVKEYPGPGTVKLQIIHSGKVKNAGLMFQQATNEAVGVFSKDA